MGHPLSRLRADRLQGHAACVHALEQADSEPNNTGESTTPSQTIATATPASLFAKSFLEARVIAYGSEVVVSAGLLPESGEQLH